jgi:hypothetical protein
MKVMSDHLTCLPEVKYYKFNFIYFLLATLFVSLPLLSLLLAGGVQGEVYGFMLFIYTLFFLPFDIYYFYQWNYFKKLRPTNIQISTLDKVESNWMQYASFLVEMDINGQKKRISTMAIFRVGWFGPNSVGDYSMKKVRVGYDPNREIAVVLEVFDE